MISPAARSPWRLACGAQDAGRRDLRPRRLAGCRRYSRIWLYFHPPALNCFGRLLASALFHLMSCSALANWGSPFTVLLFQCVRCLFFSHFFLASLPWGDLIGGSVSVRVVVCSRNRRIRKRCVDWCLGAFFARLPVWASSRCELLCSIICASSACLIDCYVLLGLFAWFVAMFCWDFSDPAIDEFTSAIERFVHFSG